MSDRNVCPYCGWEIVEIVGTAYRGSGRGRCPNCQSNGPEVSPPSAAITAFCHPTHLMETLHTFDPETEVVIKRETAATCFSALHDRRKRAEFTRECHPATSAALIADADAAAADLTAALEVPHVRD